VGIPFIEKARALGIKLICVHKGLPLPGQDYEYSTCRDIGPVAKAFPDMTFIVYHSGYESGHAEGAYNPQKPATGIDRLIASLEQNGIRPGGNVYAELGSTWRNLMREPNSAAHALGKLFKHVGEDRVLWGTDSIWYGSPQDQIVAFRAFQISPELRETHGYPELTPKLRAKVFGLNAATPYRLSLEDIKRHASADWVQQARAAYAEAPAPALRSYGPRTRRELLTHWRLHGSRP
jgi:predicted TIM-barrel fold metal-dependent hydrolase